MIAGTRTNEETGKVLALRTRPGTYNQTNVKVRRGPKLRDPTKTKKKKKKPITRQASKMLACSTPKLSIARRRTKSLGSGVSDVASFGPSKCMNGYLRAPERGTGNR